MEERGFYFYDKYPSKLQADQAKANIAKDARKKGYAFKGIILSKKGEHRLYIKEERRGLLERITGRGKAQVTPKTPKLR